MTATYLYMTAKGIMAVYLGNPFYISVGNFAKAHVHLPEHGKVCEITDVLIKSLHIKYERI